MRKKRKGMIVTLIGIMLLSAACSSNSADPVASKPGNADQPSGKEGAVQVSIMAKHDQPEISVTDALFIEELEKKNNVKLSFEIPPVTGYTERLQLMLASGKYPDVVFFDNTTDQAFQNAVREGILIPVNDYLESAEYLNQYTYQSSWDQLKVNQDGNIYGIPRTSVVRNDGYWVRKDWIDNVGFELPANSEITIAQFEELLKKFTFDDPDRNGKNDTYGYAGAYNMNKVLDPILTGQFGLMGWQKASDGEYEYMNPMYDQQGDEFKKALEFSASLYKAGVFDPDSATNDGTKQRERFWRGLTGVYPGFAGHYTWHLTEMQKQVPTAELTFVHVQNEQGEVKGGNLATSPTGLWGFWAITKNAENPQKIVDLFDSWLSDEMWPVVVDGYEGHDYTVEGGEKQAITGPPKFYIRRNSMRRANDTQFFITTGTPKDIVAQVEPWLQKSVDTVVAGKDLGFQPEAAKKPNFMDYQKVWDQTTMKILIGELPVSELDSLLEGWYKNGGTDFIQQMNEYIKLMDSDK
ncbi:extracellular solute-binding protein [Paenibacillaceae bacterium]|nr:extracellular solute-binding protein [Paenibacillaceae bacterium]